jgi:glycosyltransferase involved in cell wall biosynthesis
MAAVQTGIESMPRVIRVLFAMGSMGGGGSERQVAAILRRLDRTRFAPALYLVYPAGEFLEETPDDVPVFSFWGGRRAPRLYWPGRIHRMQAADLANVIRRESVDVVYDRTYFMTLIAAAAAKQAKTARISVVVSDPRLELEHAGERFIRIKRRLLRRAYAAADRVAAVSEAVRTSVIDYYRLPPQQVVAVPNFLDLERVDRLAAEAAPQWDAARFHIVAAGRLHTAKGYRYLLEAVDDLVSRRNHRRLLLHVFGQGPLEVELRSFVRSRGLQDHVRFAGFVANPFPALRTAQLFCLASIYDGMPNVLLEAMACGVPVLAADCPGGVREILGGGKYGRLVPPADSAALADAIEDALVRHDQWRAVAPAARARVAQAFSPTAGMRVLEELLRTVARNRRPRTPSLT